MNLRRRPGESLGRMGENAGGLARSWSGQRLERSGRVRGRAGAEGVGKAVGRECSLVTVGMNQNEVSYKWFLL